MKLIFDAPGPWTHTWIEEVKDGRVVVTRIGKGEVVDAGDLKDGSRRSDFLNQHLAAGTCHVLKEKGSHKE